MQSRGSSAELHLCYVIKGHVWWKRTLLPMITIVVSHHKHMKLFKPFTPHVSAWSVRKGFNQSIRRTKEQTTTLQCLAWAMPKPLMPSGAVKSAKLLRKSARTWQCKLKRHDWIAFSNKTCKVKAVALTRAPENEGENENISLEITFTLSLAGHIDMFFLRCFCFSSLVSAYCSGECCFMLIHLLACEILFLSKNTL